MTVVVVLQNGCSQCNSYCAHSELHFNEGESSHLVHKVTCYSTDLLQCMLSKPLTCMLGTKPMDRRLSYEQAQPSATLTPHCNASWATPVIYRHLDGSICMTLVAWKVPDGWRQQRVPYCLCWPRCMSCTFQVWNNFIPKWKGSHKRQSAYVRAPQ